eukprot:TRINITY_DN22284_c0_g1_i2.p1 TRINITY_DN22284_c0_g1~~TRINITY_DN22284_c0_g1_i2.p1  ORF type:complete len:295 (+),score=26.75 TRINITY_DN22284_c0_g1_i2:54-938(+)
MLLFDSCSGPERTPTGSPGLCGSCRRQPPIPEPSSRELSTSRALFTSPEQSAIYASPGSGLDDIGFREASPSPGHSVSTWQSAGPDRFERPPLPVSTLQSLSTDGSDSQLLPGRDAAPSNDAEPLVNGSVPDLALVYSLLHSVSHLHLKAMDPGTQVSRPLPVDQISSRESRALASGREHSRANTSHTLSREYSRVHTPHSRERSRVHFNDFAAPEASRPSRAEIVLVGEVKRLERAREHDELAARRLWQQNQELQRRVQDLHGRNSLLQGKHKELQGKYKDLHEHLADATFRL